MMDKDKAIRAAKLTAGAVFEKNRAKTAVTRAGGQIAPSKYLPNVPRAVHADGGREDGGSGGMNLYRGTNDSGERITGGIGEGLFFGTPHEDVARLYGDRISQFELPSHAKILTEGSGEFSKVTNRKKGPLLRNLRAGENLRDAANEAIARAKEAGYDAVHFNSMRDMGVAVLNPDILVKKAEGGAVTDTNEFRNWFGNSVTHTNGDPHVFYTGTSKDKDFTSHNVGRHGAWFVRDPEAASSYAEQNDSQGYKREGFKLTPTNTASRVIPAYVKAENPYTGELPGEYLRDNYKAAQSEWFDTLRAKGHDSWVPASQNGNLVVALKEPQQIKSIFNSGKFDPNQKHMNKAEGGRVGYADGGRKLNEHGFYSKALEAARNMQQAKGTPEQFMAQLRNAKGVKQSELDSIGMPKGDKITQEDFVRHISSNLPRLGMSQLGADPSFLSPEDQKFLRYATNNKNLTPEEDEKRRSLDQRRMRNIGHSTDDEGNSETLYPDYITGGGKNYRERLIKLTGDRQYQSSHWDDANVLAHVRMHDRVVGGGRDEMQPAIQKLADHLGVGVRDLGSGSADVGVKNGVISPEEAATLSRLMRWQNGYETKKGVDKKLLHVEEIQSDWGQEGRKDGFHDPKNPYEVVRKDTKEVVSRHPDYGSMWDAYRTHPDSDNLTYGDVRNEKPPEAPFVQNTQHWTDLAMKQILREAALGDYDGIVFTPGQAQADRYGLDKKVQSLSLSRPQDGSKFGRLVARDVFGGTIHNSDIADEKELHGLIGKDMGEKLLSSSPVANTDDQTLNHQLEGDDLKMGGEGMKNYYDKIVPKSAMNLVRQHDPSAQPQSMNINGEYDALHIPLSSTAKESIGKNGFQMFNKGGAVEARSGYGDGGMPQQNGEPNVGTEVAPNDIATRPQAGGLPITGGVRGGSGVLQTQNEAPLEGLPQKIKIPLTGQYIKAGADPRIRQVARDYMAQTGMTYDPPKKYARVDPKRAERIAAAYTDMEDNHSDPLTKASYDAMIKETMAQYKAAKDAGFKAEFWHPDKQEDPYKASPRLATEDVRNNHHMWVYPTYAGYGSGDPISEDDAKKNPLLQLTGETWNGIPVTVNDVFRAVHDYYGHAKEGVGFRGDGEENAWRAHASMFSPLARLAMTSETRGQNSWLNYGPHGEHNRTARTEDTIFAPQKIGVLPHFALHDGAEDFMKPEEISAMAEIYKRYGRKNGGAVDAALALTRRFTKNGNGVTMALKPRGK